MIITNEWSKELKRTVITRTAFKHYAIYIPSSTDLHRLTRIGNPDYIILGGYYTGEYIQISPTAILVVCSHENC